MESSGTGAEDHSNSGPSPSRNPFDLANILRSSPFAGSLSSPAFTYPPLSHIPGTFPMLDPHPLFPGAALIPFGGLGSLGESLMSSGVLGPSLGSAANGADWWRAASEQASRQMTADSMGPGAFYAGLNGTFGSPLFRPLLSTGISNTSGTASSDNLSASTSSAASNSKSSKSHRQSLSSLPIPKNSKDTRGRKEPRTNSGRTVMGNQEESSHTSSARSSGKAGTAIDRSSEKLRNNSSSQQLDYSLENSLLSAEAALYSASPFFFPFGAMAALSSAFGGMPFPGSSGMYSCPTTSPAYMSPFASFPSHTSTSTSKMSATESPVSQKSKSESRTWTPVSRMSSAGTPGADTSKPSTPVSPHRNRNAAISPCELGRNSGGDHKKESHGTAAPSVIVSRGSSTQSTASSASTLSNSNHKLHLIGKTGSLESDERNRSRVNSPQKVIDSELRMTSTSNSFSICGGKPNKSNERRSSTAASEVFDDSSLYSIDGAIDLSMKKRRTESPPARVPVVATPSSKSSNYCRNSAAAAGSLVPSSQADVLSTLAHSHQMYAEHQAQLLASNQMAAAAAAAGLTDPLSFNLAAAALLPQMYADGMTGLFYPPSALAAMAAASGAVGNLSPTEKLKSSRGRGKRKGLSGQQQQQQSSGSRNRGRGSSHFISRMMQMSGKPEDSSERKSCHGAGTAEGEGGMRGHTSTGKGQVLLNSASYIEEKNHQDPIWQQTDSEMQQHHHHQLKLLQKMHQKKDSSLSGASSECGSGGVQASAKGVNKRHNKETLLNKPQHQSKLAEAVKGQDSVRKPSPELTGSPLFKRCSSISEYQLMSAEYDGSFQTDSDVGSGSSECSDSQKTTSDSESRSHTTQGSEGGKSAQRKRKQEDEVGQEKKRQRVIVDEAEVRIPLELHGWQRETRILSCTPKKLIGEVVYVAPCGKTLRNSYEVEEHLEQVENKDLSRENFTFSTKINLGKFFEPSTSETLGYSQLSDAEVQERFAAIEERKRRVLEKRICAQLRYECLSQAEEQSFQMTEAQSEKKHEEQDLTKQMTNVGLNRGAEQLQQNKILHGDRQLQAMESKKSKEKQKMMRQQKMDQQQQMKIENEARNQQINEEKEAKRQQSILKEQQLGGTGMQYYSYLLHATHQCQQQQQLQQQQQRQHDEQEHLKQMMNILGLERERRRQQVLLMKVMETRKKDEEKERLKEEKNLARKLDREKKLEQKRLELFLAREQKKPMEDMCITDGKSLPELERIRGVKLAGKAFADCLMVLEFVHNFAASLGFDSSSLPTMKILQSGMTSDNDCSDEFMSFVAHIVRFALEDPGMTNPKEAVTLSGQKLSGIEITNDNISELMRIFIRSRNGRDDEVTEWLKTKPFQSLNPTQKASILAYLCNELLSSKSITGEIEKNIDSINNIRRDKWVIEGKLRKLRILQAKRFRKVVSKGQQQNEEDSNTVTTDAAPVANKKDAGEEVEESGNDSDEAPSHADGAHDSDAEEDQSISSIELDGKIEKLLKQQNQLREKVFTVSHKLSAVSFGQDRFRRRYWVLPKCGGIFVEGLESAEPELFDYEEEKEEEPISVNTERSPASRCQEPMLTNEVAEQLEQNVPAECKEREGSSDNMFTSADNDLTPLVEEVPLKAEIGHPIENSQSTSCATSILTATEIAAVSTANISVPSASFPASTIMTDESRHLDVKTRCCTEEQSDFAIQNLSDIVSQTVMNALAESPGPEDTIATSDSGFSLVQTKPEVGTKEETALQHEVMDLFSAGFRLKPRSNPFKLDEFEPGVKSVIKSEPNDVAAECNDCIDTNACIATETDVTVLCANSSEATATTKLDMEESISTRTSKQDTGNILNFSTIYNNSISCTTTSTTTSTALSASTSTLFSSFRSIDSILQPDSKIKPNNIYAGSCNTSSTSTHLTSSSSCTAELTKWNLNQSVQNGSWFNILPHVPCDASSPLKPSPPLPNPPSSTAEANGIGALQLASGCPSLCSTPGSTGTACQTPTPGRQEYCNDDLSMIPGELELQAEYAIPHKDPQPIPSVCQRGWWRISDPEQIRQILACLNLRGIRERNLQKTLEKYLVYVCSSSSRAKKNVFKLEDSMCEEAESSGNLDENDMVCNSAPYPDDKEDWNRELQRKMEIKVLADIESMEERVCHASLQGWKMSPRLTTDDSVELVSSYETDLKVDQRYIIDSCRSRLLRLEHNIERRYLKAPLGRSTQLNLASITTSSSKDNPCSSDDDSDADEETATKELAAWRSAVASTTSSAQLCLYMMQLNKCIAWEKSIMKVSCQICCCDDNEAELLLCDICDRGYHTYCVKPKIESIPEGDWYCYECISKASGDACCVVCGRHGNKLAVCEICRRRAHYDCLHPPLTRMPKKWFCNSCAVEKGKMKRKQSRATDVSCSSASTSLTSTPMKDDARNELNCNEEASEPDEKPKLTDQNKSQDEETQQPTPSSSCSSEKSSKSKNDGCHEKSDAKSTKIDEWEVVEKESEPVCNGKSIVEEDISTSQQSVDLSVCCIILTEMRKHEDAWPFLAPVSAKQFPAYRKVIRSPIDFKTMDRKLRSNVYKTQEEFAADARLVFSNCELFNEDDSSVGRAGHSMKLFFENLWDDLTARK